MTKSQRSAEPLTRNSHVREPSKSSEKSVFKAPDSSLIELKRIVYLAYLITESNVKAYVQPMVLFAMLSIAAPGVTTNPNPSYQGLAIAFPRALLYVWLYVFYFDLSNQKDPSSVEEDKINKPWRAIPSGKLSIESAERWYRVASSLLLLASSTWLGGFPEAVVFMMETWVYDYASGASSFLGKNFINALFYMTGQLGTTRVAAESMASTSMARAGFEWCGLLGLNMFTTIQIQDLRDQKGDRIKGRSTMPLAIGDGPARWVTTFFILFWSIAFPTYWYTGPNLGHVLPILIGSIVSARILTLKSPKEDRMSFHYYTLFWLPSLYAIPLLSQYRLQGGWFSS